MVNGFIIPPRIRKKEKKMHEIEEEKDFLPKEVEANDGKPPKREPRKPKLFQALLTQLSHLGNSYAP